MSQRVRLNRRLFLKGAGATALAGAATSAVSLWDSRAAAAAPLQGGSGGFDFDAPYDRIGTDCAKWDRIIEDYGRENVQVAMGVADMDFKCAPAITEALIDRVRHENWGYLKMPEDFFPAICDWNRTRHGLEIDPDLMALSDGVHPALIAALKAFARPRQQGAPHHLDLQRLLHGSARIPHARGGEPADHRERRPPDGLR